MSPSLDNIALFVEVAKTRSFTRAAEALNVPASTLSRRITELERDIGVRLLKRSTRRVDVTEAGAIYFERSQHIIDEARMAHEELVGITQQPKGRLRVSLPSSLALARLAPIMRDFSVQYPEIQCEYDLGIQAIDLLADPFDLVIRYGAASTPGIISRQLGTARIGIFASQDYLDLHGTPTIPAELTEHECLRASGSKEDSIWELTSGPIVEHINVSGRMAFNNIAMGGTMAALDMGIVPMPLCFANIFNTKPLVRILTDWEFGPIPLVALFSSRLMPAKTRVFIDFLSARLAVIL
ncbi:LysR family transcriptional regulator [Alcaligenaceae bacterium CGII-47]|nr:LysR family transcriptional regulator [Alcaligenaceae bacterium CGII-47]